MVFFSVLGIFIFVIRNLEISHIIMIRVHEIFKKYANSWSQNFRGITQMVCIFCFHYSCNFKSSR